MHDALRSPRRAVQASLTALAVLAVLAAGCMGDPGGDDGARVTVVATTSVVGDFVRELAAERIADGIVELTVLVGPNVDAHDFEPSAADMLAVSRADVIVANGAGLEAFLDKLIRSAEPRVDVTEAAEGVDLVAEDEEHAAEHDHDHEEGDAHHEDDGHDHGDEPSADDGHGHDHGGRDPHLWHDPTKAAAMVHRVATALIAADPEGEQSYRDAEWRYLLELEELDAEIRQALAPFRGRSLVTAHDALGHYADRYGLDVIGAVIPSFDSSAEVSARDLHELIDRIRRSGGTAVFAEASMPPAQVEAVAAEAGVKAVTGPKALHTDGLGPAGSGADTYLGMMRHNTRAIVDGLR